MAKTCFAIYRKMDRTEKVPHRLRVQQIATEKGFNQSSLASASHVPIDVVAALWDEPSSDTWLSTLDKLATALHVPLTTLIEDIPDEI